MSASPREQATRLHRKRILHRPPRAAIDSDDDLQATSRQACPSPPAILANPQDRSAERTERWFNFPC